MTDHVMIGADAANTLHLKLPTPPSCTMQLCGLRTKRGQASRRSKHKNNVLQYMVKVMVK